jgi:hypothetical protein
LGALREFFAQTINPNQNFHLYDQALFDYATGAKGRKRLLSSEAARVAQQRLRCHQSDTPPAIQNLLKRAYLLKTNLASRPGITKSALARAMELDPSRITQILSLLNLAPEIQNYIQALPPTKRHSRIGDREWMRLARIRDQDLQLREFDLLKRAFYPSLS